jgi:uncharacterized protein YyaL (SSP411 family)
MCQAAPDLYAATGDRRWLDVADRAGAFMIANFKDETGGFRTTVTREAATGAFLKDVKQIDEQVAAMRFANGLYRYLGSESYRALSEHGARYLAAAIEELPRPLPGVLLSDRELSVEPTHITIVGHKDPAQAANLHAAGRAFLALYKRLDWWDKREGATAQSRRPISRAGAASSLCLHQQDLLAAGLRPGRTLRHSRAHAGGDERKPGGSGSIDLPLAAMRPRSANPCNARLPRL